MNYQQEFEDIIQLMLKQNASDLHITVGRHPTIRIDGGLVELAKKQVLTEEVAREFIFLMLSREQKEEYLKNKELDFSYSYRGVARFRVNVFFQRGFMGAAMRFISTKIRTFEELRLPEILTDFCLRPQGFFLCVGPTGHGKTTTLAAMVDYINHNRNDHVITIEDPIEYLFSSDRCIVDQREVGFDTSSFHVALRSMFREDVDVAMIGEMRDAETIAAAVTAAETGHLVLSSLHTNNAAQTVDRIIDSFPADQQNQIRSQLANTLIGIVSQRLIPRIEGGLSPAVEIMIANSAIRNLIRENRMHEIDLVIETSSDEGMLSLNRSLVDLMRMGEVGLESAINYSLNPGELQLLLKK
ncbi:MAG: type IV pili twitching motility protein PilT [Candidatus Sungbacteria bacterium RIFCSPLOWO2_12_FULL_41_11]|uniref:Type IV pili twitching motility protein PilT n=1 Tax=Candidatus Sungbacteria bacterium RIFCSPLOWO2_12_FULL_41_11 TaxID=1802286 RepID=A0A1G2LTW1_9BACT|nr:MAG: type IV pili twitching motility protein PilT [Candidatus Sungbacteria bacterium RIFCSPHIGHO2_02_FULL_41_12b]OHA14302.1 MAG: type IV pili twitching motility protein PilT [Candidatus Sungbacteria bacterium RIFCSPLOWO2_12_FULL_41_11]